MKSLPEISLVWVAAMLALVFTFIGTRPDRSMVADIDIPNRPPVVDGTTP